MKELSYHECLDLILSRMLRNHQLSRVELVILCQEVKPEIYDNDLYRMLDELKAQKLIEGEPSVGSRWYSVTAKGQSFIKDDGGFTGKQEKEQLMLKHSQEALNISIESLAISKKAFTVSKINTNWAIAAAIAAIIGLAISIFNLL